MLLTLKEIRFLLQLISDKYGPGYAEDSDVSRLQSKLSIMSEAKARAAVEQSKLNRDLSGWTDDPEGRAGSPFTEPED